MTAKHESPLFVIPAEAGIQENGLDARLRGHDGCIFIEEPESVFFKTFWTPAVAPEPRSWVRRRGVGTFSKRKVKDENGNQ